MCCCSACGSCSRSWLQDARSERVRNPASAGQPRWERACPNWADMTACPVLKGPPGPMQSVSGRKRPRKTCSGSDSHAAGGILQLNMLAAALRAPLHASAEALRPLPINLPRFLHRARVSPPEQNLLTLRRWIPKILKNEEKNRNKEIRPHHVQPSEHGESARPSGRA